MDHAMLLHVKSTLLHCPPSAITRQQASVSETPINVHATVSTVDTLGQHGLKWKKIQLRSSVMRSSIVLSATHIRAEMPAVKEPQGLGRNDAKCLTAWHLFHGSHGVAPLGWHVTIVHTLYAQCRLEVQWRLLLRERPSNTAICHQVICFFPWLLKLLSALADRQEGWATLCSSHARENYLSIPT